MKRRLADNSIRFLEQRGIYRGNDRVQRAGNRRAVLLALVLTVSFLVLRTRSLHAYSSLHSSSRLSPSSTQRASSASDLPIPVGDPALKFWIIDHLAWHDAHRRNLDTRRVIFRTIRAGLGDHLKALVWVYGYAVLTRRLLIIDWSNPYPIESIISTRSVDRFIYRPVLDSSRLSRGYGSNYRFNYRDGIPPYMLHLLARNDVHTVLLQCGPAQPPDSVRDELVGSPSRFNKPGRSQIHIPKFSWAARRTATHILLEPSTEIRRRISQFQEQHGICAYNETGCSKDAFYYSVHARLGIGTAETHFTRFKGLLGHEKSIARCFVAQLKQNHIATNAVVFVASDTAEWRAIFINVMKKYMPDVRVIYYDAIPKHFRDINTRTMEGKNRFFDLHTEMIIIGNAIRTFAFRSGFPEVGFWRGHGRHYTTVNASDCEKFKNENGE